MSYMDKNFDKDNCFDGELLTSYIYGELAEPASEQVERHLLDCSECQTAFSGLSEARLSVFEWNKFEFMPMATPNISLVYKDQRSWIRTVWESFVVPHRWAAGAASFASIAIVLGLALVLINGISNTKEIAVANKTVVVPKPEIKVQEPVADPGSVAVSKEIKNTPDEESSGPEVVNISTKPVESRPRPQRHESKSTTSRQPSVSPSSTAGVNAPVRLNDFEELEDNSPRLSDLFDETEAS